MRRVALLVVLLAATSASAQYVCSVPTDPVRPTFVGYGDSIMAGTLSGNSLPTIIRGLLPAGWYKVDAGVSGETALQISTRVLSTLTTVAGDVPIDVCLLEGMVNDIKGGAAVSGRVAVDRARVSIDYMRSATMSFQGKTVPVCRRIIWVGVMPFAGWAFDLNDAATQQRAKDVNAAMLSDCSSPPLSTDPRVRCVFPYVTFEDPSRPTYLKPPCDKAPNGTGDGLHLPTSCALEYAGLLVGPMTALP